MAVVMIDSHVRSMEAFHDRAVDAGGLDVPILPDRLAFEGGQLQRPQFSSWRVDSPC